MSLALLLVASLAVAEPPADKSLVTRWPARPDPKAQIFEGNQFVALPNAPDLSKTPFTITVWVEASDLAGGDPTYGRGVARSTRGEQIGDWVLAVHPDGKVSFCNWRKGGDDESGRHVTKEALVTVEQWCQIVAMWDGKTNRIFVNGIEARHDASSTATGWTTGHEVGRGWTGAGYHWAGAINDLRIYNRALSVEDIQADFKNDPRSKPGKAVIVEAKPSGDGKVSEAIDREILAKLKEKNVTPAPAADDEAFHRRVMLDLAGRIPTTAETEAFVADTAKDKRRQLVEILLAGKEMPVYWSQVMSGWLMPPEFKRDPKFVGYLRSGLTSNKTWDRFVREMLLARPTGVNDQGASQFLLLRKEALKDNSIARDVGRALFGVNMRCAQCHDHPTVTDWTRKSFLGLSAFFARSYEFAYTPPGSPPMIVLGERSSGDLEYVTSGGKKVAPAMFLDGKILEEPPLPKDFKEPASVKTSPPPAPSFSRREALVKIATDPKSPYLKRAMVNRVWRQLMGRGLVEPVDMMYDGNRASHPKLLDLLADDFAEHGFDLRRLIAVIVQSEAYARSSRWADDKELPAEELYAVAILKPLDADQLAMSLPLATGYYDDQLNGAVKRTMAQIRASAAWPEVVAAFDGPADEFEPTATQALFLLNSDYVQKNFVKDSKLVKKLSSLPADAEIARHAYRGILSREPTKDEVARVGKYLKERGTESRAEACRELVWALFTGPEFRFNH